MSSKINQIHSFPVFATIKGFLFLQLNQYQILIINIVNIINIIMAEATILSSALECTMQSVKSGMLSWMRDLTLSNPSTM